MLILDRLHVDLELLVDTFCIESGDDLGPTQADFRATLEDSDRTCGRCWDDFSPILVRLRCSLVLTLGRFWIGRSCKDVALTVMCCVFKIILDFKRPLVAWNYEMMSLAGF